MTRRVIALALLAGASLAPAEPDWPGFRRTVERAGSDGQAVPAKVAVLWKWRNERDRGRVMSSPAVVGGRVYCGCDNFDVTCIDAEKGGPPLWTFGARSWVFSSPAVAGGRVYIGEGLHTTTDAKLYCLDAETGKQVWSFQTTSHIEATPAVSGGKVFVGAGDDGVYAIDAATGAKLWQARGLHIDSATLVVEGLVIVGSGYGEHAIGAWKSETGEVAWKVKVAACAWGPAALGPKGVIVAVGDGNFEQTLPNPKSELLCLALADGAVVWRAPLKNTAMSTSAVWKGRIYIGNRGGEFGCWDAENGKRLWTGGCGRPVLSSAAVVENAVVYGCDGGHVHALDPETGKELWKHETARDGISRDVRIVSSPAVVGGRIYFGSNNDWFYCLGEKK
ncbi:MAG: PQQ-binding-like beta-propeller repeat protein [Planctomycetes bacterium]|nr:PQQ-binding-like beta-propeller repeat protein [Planctomycetota bacterium]